MANRTFNRRQSLEKEIKDLYLRVSIGSSGAPTIVTGYGIASITRTSAGLYQVTLSDKYNYLRFFEGILQKSTGEDIYIQLKAEDVASAKTIDFFTLTGATATDPSSGSALFLKFELKNTSAV